MDAQAVFEVVTLLKAILGHSVRLGTYPRAQGCRPVEGVTARWVSKDVRGKPGPACWLTSLRRVKLCDLGFGVEGSGFRTQMYAECRSL